jgi:hypothetical protein
MQLGLSWKLFLFLCTTLLSDIFHLLIRKALPRGLWFIKFRQELHVTLIIIGMLIIIDT